MFMLNNPLIIGKFDNLVKAPNNHIAANILYERLSQHFSSKQPSFIYTIQRLNKMQSGGNNADLDNKNNFFTYIAKERMSTDSKKLVDYTIAKYGGSVDYNKLTNILGKISNKIKHHNMNEKNIENMLDSDSSDGETAGGGRKRILDDDDDDDDDEEFDTALDDFDYELRKLSLKKRDSRRDRIITPFVPSPYILPFPYLKSSVTDDLINTYIYSTIYEDLNKIFIPSFRILTTELVAKPSTSQSSTPTQTPRAAQTAPLTPVTSVATQTSSQPTVIVLGNA